MKGSFFMMAVFPSKRNQHGYGYFNIITEQEDIDISMNLLYNIII